MVNLRTTQADRARLAELGENMLATADFDDFSMYRDVCLSLAPALLADVAALEAECARLAGEVEQARLMEAGEQGAREAAIGQMIEYKKQVDGLDAENEDLAMRISELISERDDLRRRLELCHDDGRGE